MITLLVHYRSESEKQQFISENPDLDDFKIIWALNSEVSGIEVIALLPPG